MKNLSELLSIYSNIYKHYSSSNVSNVSNSETKIGNEDGELEILANLAKLANMIATDPYSDITQKNVYDHERHITMFHDNIISLVNKEDDDKHKIYICKCMKEHIDKLISELEKNMEDYEDEEDQQYQKLYKQYKKLTSFILY